MRKIALIGNPNSGKTTLFNSLTGEHQKVGNFTGVTVDKYNGSFEYNNQSYQITDFPGSYSIHPTSADERIVNNILLDPTHEDYPELIVYVLDYRNLEQQLLLASQIIDLKIPMIIAISMSDELVKSDIEINVDKIEKSLNTATVLVSGKHKLNLDLLKQQIENNIDKKPEIANIYQLTEADNVLLSKLNEHLIDTLSPYGNLVRLQHAQENLFIDEKEKLVIQEAINANSYPNIKSQVNETLQRFNFLTPIANQSTRKKIQKRSWTDQLDMVLTNGYIGPVIFFLLMLLVFQAIFQWATYPMDWIEWAFNSINLSIREVLPDAWYTDLLTDGILAGISGVAVFIPQIAILFFLIGLLEEIGYMSRAVYLFDRFMSKFGMNGRSIVALVSGGACAIPAIMSTRTISNPKERLMTILVTPFIACSARIPVYVVLVGFVVPSTYYWGPFSGQGLVFMGLYLLGIVAALVSALIMRPFVGNTNSGYLMIELPDYRKPDFKNIWRTIKSKVMSFLIEAGKIIIGISIVLWFLASFGPSEDMTKAKQEAETEAAELSMNQEEKANLIASKEIEASYAGHIGKFIEPVIEPLGFDWKIGIALLSSFAAREVFIGTLSTIYSIGDASDELYIQERMEKETIAATGEKRYNLATAISLLLFFAFAMQCMSTLAVVKKETQTWKWPIIQLVFMTGIAYISSFIAYQLLQ